MHRKIREHVPYKKLLLIGAHISLHISPQILPILDTVYLPQYAVGRPNLLYIIV